MGTLLSIFGALAIIFFSSDFYLEAHTSIMANSLSACALLFLILLPARYMYSWSPLQKAETHFAPRILDLFQKDRSLVLSNALTILFCIGTLILAFTVESSHVDLKWIIALWIICLGISIDSNLYFTHRINTYLNPFSVVKLFSRRAQESIRDEKELNLCSWIDGLTEIAIKGLDQNSTSLSHSALDELQGNARLFFESSKSISHHQQDKQTASLNISDKVTYIMFYLYQRIDMVYEKALKNKLEPTCSHIISLFGKLAIDAAKYDLSLASAPLRFIGKLSRRAQEENLEETVLKASCTLLEVAKCYIREIDLTYLEIKDPYLSIINGIELLSKGIFKADKNYNLSLLTEPFKELKALFQTEKMRGHPDTAVIIQNIDRVLGEFEALRMVMNTIPTFPKIEEV